MELSFDYQSTVESVKAKGWDWLLEALNDATDSRLDLYAVSQDWLRVGPQFILKAKGANGDVIVRWLNV